LKKFFALADIAVGSTEEKRSQPRGDRPIERRECSTVSTRDGVKQPKVVGA
jgi:hypothetical protein